MIIIPVVLSDIALASDIANINVFKCIFIKVDCRVLCDLYQTPPLSDRTILACLSQTLINIPSTHVLVLVCRSCTLVASRLCNIPLVSCNLVTCNV